MPPLQPTEDKPPAERRAAGVSKRSVKVTEGLARNFGAIGLLTYTVNQYDGEVILKSALPMAESLEQIGRKNKNFYRILVILSEGSEWTALCTVFGSVLVAIGANHGLFPRHWPRVFGLETPPTRGTTEAEPEPGPQESAYSEADKVVQDFVAAQQRGEQQSAEQANPGLHISPEQFNLIREQSIRAAIVQQQLAQQQGIVP